MKSFQSNKSDAIQRVTEYVEYSSVVLEKKINTNPFIEREQQKFIMNENIVAWYDFSDPNNLGYDISGLENHGINKNNCEYVNDSVRKHCLYIPSHTANGTGQTTQTPNNKYLDFDSKTNSFNTLTSFSIAFNIKVDSIVNTEKAAADKTYVIANFLSSGTSGFMIRYISSNSRQILSVGSSNGSITNINCNFPTNTWGKFVFTMSPTGNALYKDGVLNSTYIVGNNTTYDPALLNTTRFIIGAQYPNAEDWNYTPISDKRTRFPFKGYISDFAVFNKALTPAEVTLLNNDNWGYEIIPLAGQSNMVGYGTYETGIDDDYSSFGGKVFQYDVSDNITNVAIPVEVGYSISVATNPLKFSERVNIGGGLWRTFVIEYLKSVRLPHRRKLILVPVAINATSFRETKPHWSIHTTPLGRCVTMTIQALNSIMSLNPLSRISCFLWNQGESDVRAKSFTYEHDFNTLINLFITNIPTFTSSTPIVMTLLCGPGLETEIETTTTPNTHMMSYFNNNIRNLTNPSIYPNRKYIEVSGLDFVDASLHYNNVAYREIGKRYFDAYILATGKQKYQPYPIINNAIVNLTPIQTSGWTNYTLQNYGKKTVVHTLKRVLGTGGSASFNVTVDYIRIGSIISLNIWDGTFTVGDTDTEYVSDQNSIPNELLPTNDVIINTVVSNNGTSYGGYWYFDSDTGTLGLFQQNVTAGRFEATKTYVFFATSGNYPAKNILV